MTCSCLETDEANPPQPEELPHLAARGIEIIEPDASDQFAAYEEATTRTPEFFFDILAWELRWPLRVLKEDRPGLISEGILGHIRKAEQMTLDDYRTAMLGRDRLRSLHRGLRGKVDGFITLAHIGPGQRGLPLVGTPWYNDASSAIGAPTFNLPFWRPKACPSVCN